MTVYKKQDIPDRYHFKKALRVAPLYLLADEGYVIVRVSILHVTCMSLLSCVFVRFFGFYSLIFCCHLMVK